MLMSAALVDGCCGTTDAVDNDTDVFSALLVPDMMTYYHFKVIGVKM